MNKSHKKALKLAIKHYNNNTLSQKGYVAYVMGRLLNQYPKNRKLAKIVAKMNKGERV